MPHMTPVDSSNIESVGYDTSNRELHVRFLGNRTYVYSDVPAELYEELLRAPSTSTEPSKAPMPTGNFDRHRDHRFTNPYGSAPSKADPT